MVSPPARIGFANLSVHGPTLALVCALFLYASAAPASDLSPTLFTAGDLGVVSELRRGVGEFSSEAGRSVVEAEYAPISFESLPIHHPADPDAERVSTNALTLVTRGILEKGQSLSASLHAQGIESGVVQTIVAEFLTTFDFRRSQPGHRYRLGQTPDGRLESFRYWVSSEKSFYLYSEESGFGVREDHIPLRTKTAKIGGVIENSLYEAVEILGEDSGLAADFAELFAWDIDFSRHVRAGESFQILYERLYRTGFEGEDVYVRPGRILAARYRGQAGAHSAVYFEFGEGRGSYYRPDGTSVERAFLVAPLRYSRISSSYSSARQHPILNVVRAHRGIDYAAAPGTPIWAVSDGTVIYRGRAGASGNLVKIQHPNGFVSWYAHLSRFESGLKVGDVVTQKQRIGYVGETGLATGPHVCFRMQKDGRYLDPLSLTAPAGAPIDLESWPAFAARRDLLLGDLDTRILLAADEAL